MAGINRVAGWCIVHDDQWPDDESCCFGATDGRPCRRDASRNIPPAPTPAQTVSAAIRSTFSDAGWRRLIDRLWPEGD